MEQRSAPTLILTVYRKLRAAVHIAEKDRRRPVWKQRLVVASLVSLDALLTLLIFSGASYLGQGAWGWGELLEVAVATIAPSVAVWVGLRAFLGLYPGYGLDCRGAQVWEGLRALHAHETENIWLMAGQGRSAGAPTRTIV